MRVLVGIASFGLANEEYLHQVLAAFEGMSYETDILVFSNIPRDLGKGVQVVVGLPSANPRSLGFAHRRSFIERQNDYDIFVYTEDDIEILESHIESFLRQCEDLDADEIPGLFRYEYDSSGSVCYPDVHNAYHWDPESVRRRGRFVFAEFTNLHSACYVLTRSQLQHCIRSGGYATEPHTGVYNLMCSAATDPYTTCGLRKVLCISHFDEILVHHLSDKYSWSKTKMRALPDVLLRAQLDEMQRPEYTPSESWIPQTISWQSSDFTKGYYDLLRQDVMDLIVGRDRTRILSVGCGSGETERELMEQGKEVVAIPLDNVVGSCARANGIPTLPPDPVEALESIPDGRFDCLLVLDVLQYIPDPVAVIRSCVRVLEPGGFLICSVPNFSCVSARRELSRMQPSLRNRRAFLNQHGVHYVTLSRAIKWFEETGLKRQRVLRKYADRVKKVIPPWLSFATQWLALSNTILFVKEKTQIGDTGAGRVRRDVLEDSKQRNATQ